MPITFPVQSATSTAQVVATAQVWDYVLAAGVPQANVTVRCMLDSNAQTTISPPTLINPLEAYTTTDSNGYFSFTLVPTDNMSPANCTYTITTPFRTYQIIVPSGGPWQTTAVGIIVNTPVALAPATTGLIGPLTISSGGLTVSAGGASISGGLTVASGTLSIPSGGFSMLGPLTLTANASQLIPGATSFSVRDNANANDNLLVSNAGLVTARGGLVATAGGLTVAAGGAAITGNSTVTGTLTATAGLTVSAGGLVVTAGGLTVSAGGATIAGNTAVTGTLTASSNLQALNLILTQAGSVIVPGATSLSVRNNANNANNLTITDAGNVAIPRGNLSLSGGGHLLSFGSAAIPTISNQAANLVATVAAGSTDTRMQITFTVTVATIPAGTRLFTVTSNVAYFDTKYAVVITGMPGASGALNAFQANPTAANTFDVYATTTVGIAATQGMMIAVIDS